ncbi:MAG: hypothetical protein VKO65_04395 [Cyanobacteriota bacterium]|nr:hypothetical protein [Cyanobacteriota bacterium]
MLSQEELAAIEATLLPALERHHLRLLAHALRTFQQAAGRCFGDLPAAAVLADWAALQPALSADPAFLPLLLAELAKAGASLEAIAADCRCEPLALQLPQLLAWGRRQADQRLQGDAPG